MTFEQRVAINERIDALIGTRDQLRAKVEKMNLSDRITHRDAYEKQRQKLVRLAEKDERAFNIVLVSEGYFKTGLTASGKKVVWEPNNGYARRSWYCGSLTIDGQLIYTSGTVERAFQYMIEN